MKAGSVLLICILLAGCASAPPAAAPAALFEDHLFAPASQRIDARDVFALSEEMKQYAAQRLAGTWRSRSPQRSLVEALYSKSQLKLDYDAEMTRNAAQAFEARAGNCLSLVIMTAAFAKELGLKVQYQSVSLQDAWSRSGDLYFANGHVNLSLDKRPEAMRGLHDVDEAITVDFVPTQPWRGQRVRVIDEPTVVAMYMNNKGAEALARGHLDDAYWWARAAIEQAPGYTSSYNTLGVIYLKHHNLAQAERVLNHALLREPDAKSVMGNLVTVLQRQGRADAAQQLAQRLARIEPHPPFHFFNLGQAALQRSDFQAAKDLFQREIARSAEYHEFHFWLAVAHSGLGEWQQARRELDIALRTSTSRSERDLYAGKLARLQSLQTQ